MRRWMLCFGLLLVLLSGCELPTVPPTSAPSSGGGGQDVTSDQMLLGNPSAASTSDPANYLIVRSQYALSYNRDAGIPNWVSWHVQASDLGSVDRSQFMPDPDLPSDWYHVKPSDYTNSGYDRGHMAPSADRTSSSANNQVTFYMTNVVPQAPDNNQGPWVELENYTRELVRSGKEVYIIAGPAGKAGTIGDGHVVVPESVWKIMLVLPAGKNDLQRIDANAEVIAVLLPNRQGIRNDAWQSFSTSVSAIEALTGLQFFTALPADVQQALTGSVGSNTSAGAATALPALGACGELFFSAYVEGSSNNKALAIYNPTAQAVDLGAYSVEIYSNGATAATANAQLAGALAPGATFIIANGSADSALLKLADLTSSVANFNGNDALALLHDGAIVDSIGQIGADPGASGWVGGRVGTVDQTLIRSSTVRQGRANARSAFDPSAEWQSFASDSLKGVQTYSSACR